MNFKQEIDAIKEALQQVYQNSIEEGLVKTANKVKKNNAMFGGETSVELSDLRHNRKNNPAAAGKFNTQNGHINVKAGPKPGQLPESFEQRLIASELFTEEEIYDILENTGTPEPGYSVRTRMHNEHLGGMLADREIDDGPLWAHMHSAHAKGKDAAAEGNKWLQKRAKGGKAAFHIHKFNPKSDTCHVSMNPD